MAGWEEHHWHARLDSGLSRYAQRSGSFRAYAPDRLMGAPLVTSPQLDELLARAERAVAALDHGPGAEDLAGIARFLLRSEASASSRIEGIAPSARQIAFAELAEHEDIRTFGEQARLVARNMTIVREATTDLAAAERIDSASIEQLQRALLAEERHHHGIRTVQNWIGGSDWHPLEAEFVPPAPSRVPALVTDLAEYLSGASHAPIVQAALVHAQFETIHPFTDGNGRVGRALIHTALTRRGLTVNAVLPISLVLATFRERYIRGLTAFRHDAPADSATAHRARADWLTVFATSALQAAEQAGMLRDEIGDLRRGWHERIVAHRAQAGRQRQLRSDSGVMQIMADLPSTPVLTASTVTRIHGVSENAAMRALNELRDAGILETRSTGTRARAFVSPEILDLITHTERKLASTRSDTRVSPPDRGAPARPAPR